MFDDFNCLNLTSGLLLIVYGKAECRFTKSVRQARTRYELVAETKTLNLIGKDIYLDTRTYLFGYQGASSVEIPAGIHRYSFECQLPPLLPASFEASHGHIRYNVKACLDIPWRFDKEFKLQFTVVRKDNLNDFPDLKFPCRNEQIRTFCSFFCRALQLTVTVTIPCGGFVPGQTIPITIEYINRSKVRVVRTKINLIRTIKFNR